MEKQYDKYLKEVERYYSKNYKKYHTIHHIKRLFELYFTHRDEFLAEFPSLNEEALLEAIAWHDSVYLIGVELNETFSAQLYIDYCLKKEMDPYDRVCEAILSTKIGTKNFPDDAQKVLHDLDWSSFAGYYHKFVDDSEKILFEATCDGIYSVKEVKENQLKFYELIFNENIYVTKTFSSSNEVAKKNLELRIKQLKKELEEMK